MKKVTDLKDNEAIRVNEKEWPKIIQLFREAEGSHWDVYSRFNPITNYGIDREVVIYAHCGWDKIEHNAADKTYPASDFLLPEPKFKVGDTVTVTDFPLITKAEIKETKQHPDTGNWAYMVSDGMTGCFVSEGLLRADTEHKFEVGKRYEFSYSDQIYVKGKLVAIIDHEFRYVAKVDHDTSPLCFKFIRPIQPKIIEIEKWAMYNPKNDTFFGKPVSTKNKCEEAYKHAPLDYKATKLTGRAKL